MTGVRTHNRSFAAGEITPELHGRVDLAAYQTGLEICENLLTLPHGPATVRPGFEFIQATKYRPNSGNHKVRLIEFAFNTEQTYLLEFGHHYIRFHTGGATVLGAAQTITAISNTDPAVVTYVGSDPANFSWWRFGTIVGMPEMSNRYVKLINVNAAANTAEIVDLQDFEVDATGWSAGTSGNMSPVYELATTYTADQLDDIDFVQSADVITLVHPSHPVNELSRLTATTFALNAVTFGPTIGIPQSVLANRTYVTAGNAVLASYVVTAVASWTYEESLPSGVQSTTNDLTIAGNFNTISWSPLVAGAERYNVYKDPNGSGVFGLIGQAGDTATFIDYNYAPDMSITPPIYDTVLTGGNERPSAVTYFEQRRVFGATNNNLLGFWASKSGLYKNFSRALPLRADDSIRGSMVARQVNAIRYLIPLTDLLVFTSGGEWVLSSGDAGPLTATSMRTRPQSFNGCAKIQPLILGNSVIYVQASRRRMLAMQYSWENSSYVSKDLLLLAPHLTKGSRVAHTAFSESPERFIWASREDGTLLGLTYIPEHEVTAWHRHVTDGTFHDVAVVTENNDSSLYAVVKRNVRKDFGGGLGVEVQYIERMRQRPFTALQDWFGVDAGLTYSGAAATTISGLWHLEDCDVEVLADGAVIPGLTVQNGSITLPHAASKVHIGLPYRPIAKPLPATFRTEAAGMGRAKNVNNLYLRVVDTAGLLAGRTLDTLRPYISRTTEPYGSPPSMYRGEVQIPIDGPWDADCEMYITTDGPLPLTLSAISAEIEVGD